MKRTLLIPFIAILGSACLTLAVQGESPVQGASVEVAIPKGPAIELLNPGTVIGEKAAPEGWTHLVLKSQPSLSAEEQKKVSKATAGYATMIFTATAADVRQEREGSDFRLVRLGFGVGVNVKGQDMVLSPDTESKLGANLGLIGGTVLSGVYDKQKLVRLVAATPYGAIVDTPAFMPKGDVHAAVILRYAFLADRKTGRLDTLVWRIDVNNRGASEGASGKIEWLPPATQVNAALRVDLNEFTLGIPSEKAFAVLSIPAGQYKLAWPQDMTATAGQTRLSDAEAQQIDGTLRLLMQNSHTDRVYDLLPTRGLQQVR